MMISLDSLATADKTPRHSSRGLFIGGRVIATNKIPPAFAGGEVFTNAFS